MGIFNHDIFNKLMKIISILRDKTLREKEVILTDNFVSIVTTPHNKFHLITAQLEKKIKSRPLNAFTESSSNEKKD